MSRTGERVTHAENTIQVYSGAELVGEIISGKYTSSGWKEKAEVAES